MSSSEITSHFNRIAKDYDCYKANNSYYYAIMKKTYKDLISDSEKKSILEVGCGTGDIISFLNPKQGIGIDVSNEMILRARQKHPGIKFKVGSAEKPNISGTFDYIIMSDVIEHLTDVEKSMQSLAKLSSRSTTIIITMANPLWEPLLLLAEKFGMKMPEGPHHRISASELESIFRKNRLTLVEKGNRLLVPKKIPLLHKLNDIFYKIPGVRKLGLIEYLVLKRSYPN